MAADPVATDAATPLPPFLFKEFINAVFLDKHEVLEHPHVVLAAVAAIKCFQPCAREILALETETHQSFTQQITMALHESAMESAWQASWTVFLLKTMPAQIVFHGQVTDTDTAIHPAGSDQFFIHLTSLVHYRKNRLDNAWISVRLHSIPLQVCHNLLIVL